MKPITLIRKVLTAVYRYFVHGVEYDPQKHGNHIRIKSNCYLP